MARLTQSFHRFWWDQNGQDLVEYSLLLGFVALATAAAVPAVAGSLQVLWKAVSSQLAIAAGGH